MDQIGRLTIDSTAAKSDMCQLGANFGTDKSPYSTTHHRHAYTAVYDLLFASRRFDQLVLGELGILDNMSMHVWRSFFPLATLHGFEYFDEKITAARSHRLPRATYRHVDVGSTQSIFHALNEVGTLFDILIDDSTHLFEHQINFVKVAVDFLKPGGIVVVEDVFRGWDEARYSTSLADVLAFFTSAIFIETNHDNAISHGDVEPYYNNDKLLVMFRNQAVRQTGRPS